MEEVAVLSGELWVSILLWSRVLNIPAAERFLPPSADPTSHSQAPSHSFALLPAVPESLPLAALSIRASAFI